MKKQKLIIYVSILIILIGIQFISAGSIEVNPSIVVQDSYMTISIYPTSSWIWWGGNIRDSDNNGITSFVFEGCGGYRGHYCSEPKSTNLFINSTDFSPGNYHAFTYDDSIKGYLYAYFTVLTPNCSNGIKDSNETDTDCGGTNCNPCANTKSCIVNSDCQSSYCNPNNRTCEEPPSKPKNTKNPSKYSTKETFLISDENWKNVLKLVPLTIWRNTSAQPTPPNIIKYPLLIYYKEESLLSDKFDADSIIHFLQLYSPKHVTIFGETPKKLDKLLIANNDISQQEIQQNPQNYLGAGLRENQISKISMNDYYSFWLEREIFVISQDSYEDGLMASVFASYHNAPLIFESEFKNNTNNLNVINNKKVYIIGELSAENLQAISEKVEIIKSYTLEELQKEYINLTGADKVIIVNPNDLNVSLDENFKTKKSGKINEVYSKMSLSAPFLAAFREEVIINVDIKTFPENSDCNQSSGITNNFETANISIKNQIKNLFNGFENPGYLTIISSPNAIPDSTYRKCHETNYQFRDALDWQYAPFDNMKVGRIYGITLSDASSYVSRSVFYDDLINSLYSEDEYTGLTIGHSFKRYYDNMQMQYNVTTNAGYNTSCYTGEFRQGCTTSLKPSFSEYSKKQFVIFGDHGRTDEWVDTLSSDEIPFLDLSYVFAHACLTSNFWQGNEDLMGANVLRQGAISYQGAVGISYGDDSETIALKKLTTESGTELSLGQLNKALANELKVYKRDYMLLGDPVLVPVFKEVDWKIGPEVQPVGLFLFLSLPSNGYITFINTTKKIYLPEDDIVIIVNVSNENPNSTRWYLEYDVFAENSNNSYMAELQNEEIFLNANEEKQFNFSMKVVPTMPAGNHKAVVKLLTDNDDLLDEKNVLFRVEDTLGVINLKLLVCEDESCFNESTTFEPETTIYLDYKSPVPNLYIESVLILPNDSEQQILLPYNFLAFNKGNYVLEVNASKQGYENNSKKIIFSVVESINLSVLEICNANNVCELNENYQNCPQDCCEPIAITIKDCDELRNIKNNLNCHYVLENDIDCSDYYFNSLGNSSAPFTGKFDGRNHKIVGLTINKFSENFIGLFSSIYYNAEVKNIGLEDIEITSGYGYVGGLAGYNIGNIKNSYTTGYIESEDNYYESGYGSYIGGLVGYNSGNIINSFSVVNLKNEIKGYSGGLVGYNNEDGIIVNSYSAGQIDYKKGSYVGGLSGFNLGNVITSFAVADLEDDRGSYIGGLAGENKGAIENSYWYKERNCEGDDDCYEERINCYYSGNYGCVSINYIDYFFNKSNYPMSVWNFNDVWQENINNYPILQKSENCSESDSGQNYSKKGITSNETVSEIDFCTNNVLSEYYCDNDVVKLIEYDCGSENKICVNGACRCKPKTCSELGKQCGSWSDGCSSVINCGSCSTGKICQYGFCVESCIDSDGGRNLYVKGNVTSYNSNGVLYTVEDKCIFNNQRVLEYFCSYGKVMISSFPRCLNGCIDGACT